MEIAFDSRSSGCLNTIEVKRQVGISDGSDKKSLGADLFKPSANFVNLLRFVFNIYVSKNTDVLCSLQHITVSIKKWKLANMKAEVIQKGLK